MNNKGRGIPIPIPAIGGAQQQVPFDISQARQQNCLGCKSNLFDLAYRVGIISSMAPGNKTGQNVTVKYEAYICHECGLELGKQPETKHRG